MIDELLKWERRLSHNIQTAIEDPNITVPSATVAELIQIRDDLRKRIWELGYRGHF